MLHISTDGGFKRQAGAHQNMDAACSVYCRTSHADLTRKSLKSRCRVHTRAAVRMSTPCPRCSCGLNYPPSYVGAAATACFLSAVCAWLGRPGTFLSSGGTGPCRSFGERASKTCTSSGEVETTLPYSVVMWCGVPQAQPVGTAVGWR